MRIIDSVRRSGRNLRQAKLRTLLTMLAISVGSFALMITLAAGEGARQFVDRLVATNFNPRSIYVFSAGENDDNPFAQNDEPKEYDSSKQAVPSNPAQRVLHNDDITKIGKHADIERVVPMVSVDADYVTVPGAKKFESKLKSIDEGVRYEAVAGSIPTILQDNQVIIPETFVAAFGFNSPQQAIGKQVTVHFSQGLLGNIPERQFEVVAVAKKPSGLLGGAREMILSQAAMQKAYEAQRGKENPSYVSAIVYAKNDNPLTLSSISEGIKKDGFQSMSARDLAEQVTQAVNIVQYFVAGFGIIALIVSIFGIVNTQLISVLERTREIGLMKALGISGTGVMRLFTLEAMWIGFGGALIGILMAYIVSIFINPFLSDKLGLGGNLLIFLPIHAVGLVGGLMLIAALAGLLPAWKAARLNPIVALRTE